MKINPDSVKVLEFNENLAPYFKSINEEWIAEMFSIEKQDLFLLDQPYENIIKPGGLILFAEAPELGVVGTCALLKDENGDYELAKMGVLKKARGYKAGELLLAAIINKARSMGIKELYLLTNTKCEAAIHLYRKAGFVDSPARLSSGSGKKYSRCDLAMDLKL